MYMLRLPFARLKRLGGATAEMRFRFRRLPGPHINAQWQYFRAEMLTQIAAFIRDVVFPWSPAFQTSRCGPDLLTRKVLDKKSRGAN